ncbi:MAG: VOC family protein [Pseudomonadota bacterium]
MSHHLRIARPVSNLTKSQIMYCAGLDLSVIGGFLDHEGFDGVMLGHVGTSYHFEFTHCRSHPVMPSPTNEDLAIFYIELPSEWQASCKKMLSAGFNEVNSFNPYWANNGRTFQDHDGYRVVLVNSGWRPC